MHSPARPSSPLPESRAAPLDRDRIAATALTVLDTQGISGFTIRSIAAALGVTPMAIYHHVENKSELAKLVVNRSHHELQMAPPSGDWKEDLWIMARWVRETTLAHPAVRELRRTYRIYTPEMFSMAERWMEIWQQSGLPQEKIVIAARVSGTTVDGLVMEEETLRNLDRPDEVLQKESPSVQAMYEIEHDPLTPFELAVRAQIDGLYARLSAKT